MPNQQRNKLANQGLSGITKFSSVTDEKPTVSRHFGDKFSRAMPNQVKWMTVKIHPICRTDFY